MQAAFHHIRIPRQHVGSALVLDAISSGDSTRAFFAAGCDTDGLTPAQGTAFEDQRTVGRGLIIQASDTRFEMASKTYELEVSQPQLELFDGLNTALAFRNEQSAEITLDWLRWHVERHNLEAALIVDRSRFGQVRDYKRVLKQGLKSINGLKQVVLLQFDSPLGQPDMPHEHHPFSAPDAPRKDRMETPVSDPWHAPLGQPAVFELLRYRFLNSARAVAQLDVTDLLLPEDGPSLFDRVQNECVVSLEGHHCYPWRVRPKDEAHFADHICRQFDARQTRMRWCIAPKLVDDGAVWRFVRIAGMAEPTGKPALFMRFMGLRHPVKNVAHIVPKTSLIEDETLLNLSLIHFGHRPLRMPTRKSPKVDRRKNSVTILTTMKNEGPFILEWIAYHRVIGVENFLIYTNDCTDGTDAFHDLLQAKGIVEHRDNPFRETGLKPQHAALQAGEKEDIIQNADWVICMDVDEFINIKTGDGTLSALFEAVGEANMISLTWRLFGNSHIHTFSDRPVIDEFTCCAHEQTPIPHQAWGFKTLFRNVGLFKKLGVHRPKGLIPQLLNDIHWVNGSGAKMPQDVYKNAWRSDKSTVGYDLVSLNHYAVRSAESFLVKRDRGRVNHVDRDQGLAYWFRMNHNVTEDHSIKRMLPALRVEMDRLLSDPDIAQMHAKCVAAHREKIDALKAQKKYAKFYSELTSDRMQRLSQQLPHFGTNVFLAGPNVIPEDVALAEHPKNFVFNVARQKTTAH